MPTQLSAQTAKQPNQPTYLALRTVPLREALRLDQAMVREPTLAALAQRAQQSASYLKAVLHLLPVGMRSSIQAGPLDEGCWCLLAANSACASKLRQLAPALGACLRERGMPITELRIKITMQS
jgi:hypothetical protein